MKGTESERFWAGVDTTGVCWVWTKAKTPKGYGQFWFNQRLVCAHRWSYSTFVAPIEDGNHIDHLCHNPSCVRPSHLMSVTRAQNQWNLNKPQRNNQLGFRGVYRNHKRFMAMVTVDRKQVYLGTFDTPEEASVVVQEKIRSLYDPYSNWVKDDPNELDRLLAQ